MEKVILSTVIIGCLTKQLADSQRESNIFLSRGDNKFTIPFASGVSESLSPFSNLSDLS